MEKNSEHIHDLPLLEYANGLVMNDTLGRITIIIVQFNKQNSQQTNYI